MFNRKGKLPVEGEGVQTFSYENIYLSFKIFLAPFIIETGKPRLLLCSIYSNERLTLLNNIYFMDEIILKESNFQITKLLPYEKTSFEQPWYSECCFKCLLQAEDLNRGFLEPISGQVSISILPENGKPEVF